MINSGLRGKRTKDTVGILSTADHFNQQNYLIPTVTSFSITDESYVPIDDTAVDTAGGQTIVVNGSGFFPGATVTVGGDTISVVTFVDSSRLAFTAPAKTSGSYTIFVTNANGGTGILVPGLVYSGVPTFYTAAGTLGTLYETTAINKLVEASGDEPVTFSLSSGSLPTGATLSANGAITGTSPVDSGSTTYSFTVKATDAQNQDSLRSFSLTINTDVVTWSTPAADTSYSVVGNSLITPVTLSAASAAGYGVQYTANSLPTGLSLSGGSITGTPTVQETTYTLLTATANTTGRSATRTISWTVVLGDTNWKNVSLLLNGSTPTPTFINDVSLNNSQLTVAGDTRPSNFNPYTEGYYSTLFAGGTADYLTGPSNSSFAVGTGDITVECWLYQTSISSYPSIFQIGSINTSGSLAVFLDTGSSNRLIVRCGGSGQDTAFGASGLATIPLNVWTHLAVVRSSGNWSAYINGVKQTYYNNVSNSITLNTPNIGGASGTGTWGGHISNLRVSNTALYSTTFTVPTSPYTATASTLLLTCQSNRLIDNSKNAFTLTPTGTPKVSPAYPFSTPTTASYNTGYSTYFDASNGLSIPDNTAFNLAGTPWTIDCWVYPTGAYNYSQTLVAKRLASSPFTSSWDIVLTQAYGYLGFYNGTSYYSTTTVPTNQWNHVAAVYDGTNINLYLNGTRVLSSAATITNVAAPVYIGNVPIPTYPEPLLGGYISNVRIVKGTALYSGTTLTVPTAKLTAVSGTSLLTCQDATLIDNSTNNFTITSAGQTKPIAVSPFTMTTSNTTVTSLGSAYFDGTGDYLQGTVVAPGTADFTMEGWVYFTALGLGSVNVFSIVGSGSSSGWQVYGSSNYYWGIRNNGVNITTGTGTPTANTWYHVAVVRKSGTITLYINGVYLSSTSSVYDFTDTQFNAGYSPVGAAMTGYVSDIRYVKGTALYTANFLPPQAPLTPVANTQLLTCRTNGGATNNGFVDQSSFNNIITRTGNVTQGAFSPFSQNGWSVYWPGTNPATGFSTNITQLITNDFTIEFWFYIDSLTTSGGTATVMPLVTNLDWYNGVSSGSVNCCYNPVANTVFVAFYTGSSDSQSSATEFVLQRNLPAASLPGWHHVAFGRKNTTTMFFALDGSYTSTTMNNVRFNYGNTRPLYFGRWYNYAANSPTTDRYFKGYLSNIKYNISEGLYTGNFTPSTTPPTAAHANTKLLTASTGLGLVDNSSNNTSMSVVTGTITQAFSPFGGVTSTPISYSNYFDGTGDYLTLPSSNNFVFDGDFTIEAWIWQDSSYTSTRPDSLKTQILFSYLGTTGPYQFFIPGSTSAPGTGLGWYNGSADWVATIALGADKWNHIAFVRSGTNLTGYVNGVGTSLGTISGTMGDLYPIQIGGTPQGTYYSYFKGYINNLRIVKGTALYTTNFTPTTVPLTAVANTSLLTCQSATMVDNSTNNFAITATGDVKPKPFNPFGTTTTTNVSYTPAVNGGSMYFDGTGDYLQVPAGTAFAYGTGSFTIQCWVYVTATPPTYGSMIWTQTVSGTNYLMLSVQPNLTIRYTTTAGDITSANSITLNAWNHIALVRTSGVAKIYINGVQSVSSASTIDFTNTTYVPTIGRYTHADANLLTGYVSDLQVVKGTALYTSNFYPGSAPATPTSGTTLLLNGTSGGIIDAHGSNNLETVGNTQLASEDPYGGSYYSNYFDGTGDYLSLANNNAFDFGSGDLTVECWFMLVGDSAANPVGNKVATLITTLPDIAPLSNDYSLGIGGDTSITGINVGFNARQSGTNQSVTYTATITKGVWHHLAATKTGNTATLYYDGAQVAQNTSFTNQVNSNGTGMKIGTGNYGTYIQPFNGYISNIRVVKGSVLYTGSTYTVPTAPLTSVSGTSLLTCQSNKFKDNSTNNFTITVNGDTKVKSMNPFQNNIEKSLYFDGTGDYLTAPNNPGYHFGTGDFTVETWVYWPTTPGATSQNIVNCWSSNIGWELYFRGTGNANAGFAWYYNSSFLYTGVVPTAGVWYHFAVTRASGTTRIFINGVSSATLSNDTTNFTPTAPLYVGIESGTTGPFTGYIKDLRITKGVARYTTTFTPPTAPLQIK